MTLPHSATELAVFLEATKEEPLLAGKTPDELMTLASNAYAKIRNSMAECGHEMTVKEVREALREARWDIWPETFARDIIIWLEFEPGSLQAEFIMDIYRTRGREGLQQWLKESMDDEDDDT